MAIYDSGFAPNVQKPEMDTPSVPRSAFNMSRVVNTNGIIGAIIPFDVMECLPNEDYTIKYNTLALTRNPLVRRLNSGMKIIIHSYACYNKDLWEGWRNFIDKGRKGTHVASVPKLMPIIDWTLSEGGTEIENLTKATDTRTVFSPSTYMGLPALVYDKTSGKDNNKAFEPIELTQGASIGDLKFINNNIAHKDANDKISIVGGEGIDELKWEVSALPFVMYNKIYRDYYANANLLQDNEYWYPENEEDALILPYSCNEGDLTGGGHVNCCMKTSTVAKCSSYYDAVVPNSATKEKPFLNVLHFRQFRGDYFTTANPFENLLRGNASAMAEDVGLTIDVTANTDWSDALCNPGALSSEGYNRQFLAFNGDSANTGVFWHIGQVENDSVWAQGYPVASSEQEMLLNTLNKVKTNVKGRVESEGTMLSALRKMVVLEKFMMRNGCTDGTYKELIGAQFGYTPKDHDRKPIYIGGATQDISFNTVVSTSGDNSSELADNKLGMETSKGVSAGSGYIGKFHSDDYGYIMSVMMIVPEVYYDEQGLDTMWTRTEQNQQYYPLLNNLDAQPIKNKEIYFSNDADYNEDVWGYANVFEDMKHRRNIITGLGVLGSDAVYDSANFMKRSFTNTNKPELDPMFMAMTPDNIDMTPFTSKKEPPFDLMIGCCIDKVSPMPYAPKPADMGIKY